MRNLQRIMKLHYKRKLLPLSQTRANSQYFVVVSQPPLTMLFKSVKIFCDVFTEDPLKMKLPTLLWYRYGTQYLLYANLQGSVIVVLTNIHVCVYTLINYVNILHQFCQLLLLLQSVKLQIYSAHHSLQCQPG